MARLSQVQFQWRELGQGVPFVLRLSKDDNGTHGDFAVVYMVADDLSQIMQNFASSSDPFDQWFAQTVMQGAHGMDLTQLPPPNPVIIDIVK